MAILRSFFHVGLTAILIAIPVILGHFDAVLVETSLDHYAEKPWPWVRDVAPWLPMPANTAVNAGYVLVGLWWLFAMSQCRKDRKKRTPETDAYMSYAFSWMAVMYAGVQTWRILSQQRAAAILDQWYTLPIFSWVATWSCHLLYGWSPMRMAVITMVSVSSYGLALLHDLGFETALCLHIVFAIACGSRLYMDYDNVQVRAAFFKALVSCAAFVILKLLDHPLADISPAFSYISGHFLSKIADFLQIYYVAEFYFLMTLLKNSKRRF